MIYKLLISLSLVACTFSINAQTIYDVNFGTLRFLAANMTFKTGTNGTTAGAKTLYTNVITIGGQQIDCIVTTVSLTNASFNNGVASPYKPFDVSGNPAGVTNNSDDFFSPTLSFQSGGGSCKFSFQFILGGSYSNVTNTGTNVILKNVKLNALDIDGDGGSGKQYNEYGGFYCSILSNNPSTTPSPTNLSVSYNSSTGLTKFSSKTSSQVSDIFKETNRVTLLYNFISTFEIIVGNSVSGSAFFFLDFSDRSWPTGSQETQNCNPSIDLNTTTAGLNNSSNTCGSAVNFDFGATNYTTSSGLIVELILTFDINTIKDGNAEMLIPSGSTNGLADTIGLAFGSSSNEQFTLGGVTYQAQKSISASTKTIKFVKYPSGDLSTSEIENLLDALQYVNTATSKTAGVRSFDLKTREAAFTSPTATYNVTVDCTVLPIILNSFEGKCRNGNVILDWTTSFELNNMGFVVERSIDAVSFEPIGFIKSLAKNGNSYVNLNYFFIDSTAKDGDYFRLSQIDFDGKRNNSKVIYIHCSENIRTEIIYPNPARSQLNIAFSSYAEQELLIQFIDQLGVTKFIEKISIKKGLINRSFSIKDLIPGLYYIKIFSYDTNGQSIKPFIVY